MNSRNLFQTLALNLAISCLVLGCGNDNSAVPGASTVPTRVSRFEFKASDMTIDRLGATPRYKVSKSVPLEDKVTIRFSLDALDSPEIVARESHTVLFENGNEVLGSEWPVESPTLMDGESVKEIVLSKAHVLASEKNSKKMAARADDRGLTLKLRIRFSNSIDAGRTFLTIIDVPLSD